MELRASAAISCAIALHGPRSSFSQLTVSFAATAAAPVVLVPLSMRSVHTPACVPHSPSCGETSTQILCSKSAPCVCPKPVLAKDRFHSTAAQKRGPHLIRKRQRPGSHRDCDLRTGAGRLRKAHKNTLQFEILSRLSRAFLGKLIVKI